LLAIAIATSSDRDVPVADVAAVVLHIAAVVRVGQVVLELGEICS
jgi:hypothetical protein